jgi:hypothetical protein
MVAKKTIKKLSSYKGEECNFVAVAENAYVTCGLNGEPIFDRGEVEIAKLFGAEFPEQETRVSIGPHRGYDITGEISADKKVIFIDIYSVRCPGVKDYYVTELLSNAHRVLGGKKLTVEQLHRD